MKRYIERHSGRIWMSLLVAALAVAVVVQGDALAPAEVAADERPFLTALMQLGILYIVALFVERSLEVLLKAWRQGGKTRLEEKVREAEENGRAAAESELRDYRAGTQRRALLFGLTLGLMVSLAGVRLLGPIFDLAAASSFQQALFQFTDIILTAGLIAGGSAAIHELMALIDDLLRAGRKRARQ